MDDKAAAEKMHYHGNTIRYHLAEVEEKTGYDPRKFNDLVRIVGMIKEDKNEC